MAEYSSATWMPTKADLEKMLLQGRVIPVTVWFSNEPITDDTPQQALWFRIKSMRQDPTEGGGFVFRVLGGTVATVRADSAEQVPFTGVFYSPPGRPIHWNQIDFPNSLIIGEE